VLKWKALPPYLEDDFFLLCPRNQLVLKAVRVAVRAQDFFLCWQTWTGRPLKVPSQVYCLAACTVRNAVQDVQRSSQSPLLMFLSHTCHGSMVYSHQMPGTWPLFKPMM